MVYKCCVAGCRGNYDLESKVKVFRLPHTKYAEERQRWLAAIPRDNIPDTANTFICEEHWPEGYETKLVYGKLKPLNPPSVFTHCVKTSLIPTQPPPPRPTKRTHSETRNTQPDELELFLQNDRISLFKELKENISEIIEPYCALVLSQDEDLVIIQSKEYFDDTGLPKFMLKIFNNLTFVSSHCGNRCAIKPLSSNNMTVLNSKSRLEVAMNFLYSLELNNKQNVIVDQLLSMGSLTHVGDKKYSSETIARAFEYFSISQSLYSRLRDDYQLPSINLLTNLTSKVNNTSDEAFLKGYFQKCTDQQKNIVLIIDEIYVKPKLTYQGGNVFGKAVNSPNNFATTVVAFMFCSLFGGKKFLFKVLPVYSLDATFQYNETVKILEVVQRNGGTVKAILCDNNRVNQRFFKMFELENPWKTVNNVFLLYDYVHLMKTVRNNWITEKLQQLSFNDNQIAKWGDIKALFEKEKNEIVRLSKLTEKAVTPKPIERQNVSLCLKVFCEETVAALKLRDGDSDTVQFLTKFVQFFKITNVKHNYENVHTRDELRAAFSSVDDDRLLFLLELADMTEKMGCKKQGNRIKQLTKDTSRAFAHTCRGMVDLVKHLLANGFSYVCLGHFSSDPIEKMFGKLRQGSGGTYFINVQQVLQKVAIANTKLCLDLNIEINEVSAEHSCEKCKFIINDESHIEVFENLAAIEESVNKDVKNALVYIAGYVMRKDLKVMSDTYVYLNEYGDFIRELNRGGLALPGDNVCQWVIYSYILFHEIYSLTCRKSLCNVLMMVSDFHRIENIEKHHGQILSNILLNNYSHLYTPRSSKERKLKVLKLSET